MSDITDLEIYLRFDSNTRTTNFCLDPRVSVTVEARDNVIRICESYLYRKVTTATMYSLAGEIRTSLRRDYDMERVVFEEYLHFVTSPAFGFVGGFTFLGSVYGLCDFYCMDRPGIGDVVLGHNLEHGWFDCCAESVDDIVNADPAIWQALVLARARALCPQSLLSMPRTIIVIDGHLAR